MSRAVVSVFGRAFFLFLMGCVLADAVPSVQAEAPFVSGFDRFARHADIDKRRAGQLLLTELSCTACHVSDTGTLAAKGGPRLDGAADRINGDWISEFLLSPQTVKPGTTMPDVLAGIPAGQRRDAAEALTAFLASQHKEFPELKAGGGNPLTHEFWNKGDVERGRETYHRIGCVACHAADPEYETVETKPSAIDELLDQLDPEELAEMGLAAAVRPVNSVPHPVLSRKYSRRSLAYFLLNPELTRSSGRMPSLKLEPAEAADITAWLLKNQAISTSETSAPAKELVEKGRRLFAELRCANCHAAEGIKPVAAKPLSELVLHDDAQCFGKPSMGLPHIPLDDMQVDAIRAALENDVKQNDDLAPLAKPTNDVDFTMLQLNCYGCHERNKTGGVGRGRRAYFETVGHVDIGDEGRIPPPLTGVGRKLQTSWITKVLAGTGDVRPYMQARMPKFPQSAVATLPKQLADADQTERIPLEAAFKTSDDSVSAGRSLMDVGCVQCHTFGGDALPGVVGIDLFGVSDRIHSGWFREFMLNPSELKPRTRMPSFFPGGKSQHQDIFNGDAQRQIAAMWSYLKAGESQPLPEKIESVRNRDFELIPQERPIILRTFMPVAGTHAIAVGFPEGVNIAFDAEQNRLAQAWKGRFLDAQGTWFSRFTPPAEPLGDDVIAMPPGPLFAYLADDDSPWPANPPEEAAPQSHFEGYRLDADGVPTFLYRVGSLEIEDRFAAETPTSLKRRLVLRLDKEHSNESPVFARLLVGKSLTRVDDHTYANEDGLTITLDGDDGGRLRRTKSTAEWIVPLELPADMTMKVHYSW